MSPGKTVLQVFEARLKSGLLLLLLFLAPPDSQIYKSSDEAWLNKSALHVNWERGKHHNGPKRARWQGDGAGKSRESHCRNKTSLQGKTGD